MEFVRRNKYVLKCDIRKFYPSISHDIMFGIVSRSVSDPRILEILCDIIYSSGGGKNLPIGNLCSQWMGNLYMHELDIYTKQNLRVRDYIRYCDDFCLFHNDKNELAHLRNCVREFCTDRLQLTLSKSEIFPISNGLDFVGYRHFPNFILLRKRTAKKIIRRLQKIGHMATVGERQRGQVAAAYGWMKFTNSYNIRKKLNLNKLKTMTGITCLL